MQARGSNRAAGDLSIYGLRPIELVVPAARNLLLAGHVDSFWDTHRHGSNRRRDDQLPRPADVLARADVARDRPFVVGARSTSAYGWRPRASLRRSSSDSRSRSRARFSCSATRSGRRHASCGKWCRRSVCPSRWDALLMTALVPLAALGLQAVVRGITRRWRSRLIVVAVVAAAMVCLVLRARDPSGRGALPDRPRAPGVQGASTEHRTGSSRSIRLVTPTSIVSGRAITAARS